MLDFSKITTPEKHGQVLVLPDSPDLQAAAKSNHKTLDTENVALLNSTLTQCRRNVRSRVTGDDDQLIIVTGHDPGFIHPGVWAKHIVASRLAMALGGVAVNLVVDSDTPKSTMLEVPSVIDGNISVTSIPSIPVTPGASFEDARALKGDESSHWCRQIKSAMQDGFADTMMPRFLEGLRNAPPDSDWVQQMVSARLAIETDFNVALIDRRVSDTWNSPLLLDMLVNADRFAASYNQALARYRKKNKVRGTHRPIPDLRRTDGKQESAVWVQRPQNPRRRLFIERKSSAITLFAEDTELCTIPLRNIRSCDDIKTLDQALGEWRIRPRALTLTLWARLLLADLFIHGIGGAKYDRITDDIMTDYYRVSPPEMACVSATLHLNLPTNAMTTEQLRRLRQNVRRFQFNPQLELDPSVDLNQLLTRRRSLVERNTALRNNDARNRKARRTVHDEIRQVSTELHTLRPNALPIRQKELRDATQALARNQLAKRRTYFFGLYDRQRLEMLLQALPPISNYAV